jgi:hypothetical protein
MPWGSVTLTKGLTRLDHVDLYGNCKDRCVLGSFCNTGKSMEMNSIDKCSHGYRTVKAGIHSSIAKDGNFAVTLTVYKGLVRESHSLNHKRTLMLLSIEGY